MNPLSFQKIVDGLSSDEFINHEIDIDCFHPCESCALPARQLWQRHEIGRKNGPESSEDETNVDTHTVFIPGNPAHSQYPGHFAITIFPNSRLKPSIRPAPCRVWTGFLDG